MHEGEHDVVVRVRAAEVPRQQGAGGRMLQALVAHGTGREGGQLGAARPPLGAQQQGLRSECMLSQSLGLPYVVSDAAQHEVCI